MIVYCKTNKPNYEQIIEPFHGYNVISDFGPYYYIKPKNYRETWIEKKYFFTNQELREQKLEKINESR